MIIGINKDEKNKLLKTYMPLKWLKNAINSDGADVLDYLDTFEYKFLPEVQKMLPNATRKVYYARQSQLIDKLPKIKQKAINHPDKRKVYLGVKEIDKSTQEFMTLAFEGFDSRDTRLIDLLITAEYHAIVARTIYMETQEEME